MKNSHRVNAQIYLRDATEADVGFIFNSWLKSFRSSNFCKYVDNSIYFQGHHTVVEKLLKRSTTKIACDPAKPEEIYGYITYETIDGIFCLHYAYVKHTFRNLGIFKSLLAASGFTSDSAGIHSHSTNVCANWGAKFKLIYHPYVLINHLNKAEQATPTES